MLEKKIYKAKEKRKRPHELPVLLFQHSNSIPRRSQLFSQAKMSYSLKSEATSGESMCSCGVLACL